MKRPYNKNYNKGFTHLNNSCNKCNVELKDSNNTQLHPLFDFSGIKASTSILEYFCSKECKNSINKYRQEEVVPNLACLDMSMNFNKYFERIEGNKGLYKREGFEYEVNGLWDYKNTPKEFIETFEKHFGHKQVFELHERYRSVVDELFWKESF